MRALRTLAAAALLILPLALRAQLFEVEFGDPIDFGFNDPAPVEALPGNPATTLGGQRLAVFQRALDIWSSRLDGNARIRIEASFDDIGCGESTTLGLGGTRAIVRNFSGAPVADISYPIAIASAISGQTFEEFDSDISVRFNFRIDSGECAESLDGFWYGLDPRSPPPFRTASFLELVLHELAHGLGFQSLTDSETREFFGTSQRPDAMSRLIFDLQRDSSWDELTASERVLSATSGSNLVWIGERTNLRASERLLPPGRVTLSPGTPAAQNRVAWIQGFAPFVPREGLSLPIALAQGPGPGPPAGDPWHRSLACQALDNPAQVAGKLAVVRRGDCLFAEKWQNVFDAGAAGMILVDNQPEGSASAIARDFGIALDRNLPIPIWMVSDSTGSLLLQLPSDRPVRLGYALDEPPRGTNQGFINLQASTENTGSNVSHFATSLTPNSLMNPNLANFAYAGDLDQVPELLYDLGWSDARAKQAQYSGNWFNPERAGEGCQLTMDGGQDVSVLTCYLYQDGEQFWLIGNGVDLGDRYEFNEMVITRGTGYGENFDPDQVILETWGGIVMRPSDCNHARFDFRPADASLGAFTSQMTKIVSASCNQQASEQIDRSLSGNYFDVNRAGEGIQLALEADGQSWVITFYTYLDGEQVWMIGSGERSGNAIAFGDVVITRGGDYGAAFDPDQIELIPFGRFDLEFTGCNDLELGITSDLPQFGSGTRTLTRIIPRDCSG
jgi:hypothetical protein